MLTWQIVRNGVVVRFDYNGTTYFYLKNPQDNIVGIADSSGKIIANYAYDSWGKLVSITDENSIDVSTNSAHIAHKNPLRYRGYYYDSETGLYYLNSRYYDPETGRFVSGGDNLSNLNLYRYCRNNPINPIDITWEDAILLIDKGSSANYTGCRSAHFQ